jgi:hypothetical protein
MAKKPTVSLRVYKGLKMSYDENGNVQNENQRVALTHDTAQWKNFVKSLRVNGFIRTEVENVSYVDSKKNSDGFFDDVVSDVPDTLVESIKAEVAAVYNDVKPEMTPEQKEIASLKSQMETLLGKKIEKVVDTKKESQDEESIKDVYVREVGKKPYGAWDDAKISEKLEEFRAGK